MRAMTLVVLAMAIVTLAGSTAASADPPEELIGELMCTSAGNPQPLATANTPEAAWMRDFIRAKCAEGWSRQRILDTLVRQYGEGILAVPPKEGFSLAAWITPLATIFGGAGILGFLLTRWLRERKRHDAYLIAEMATTVDESDLRRYEAQLTRELERFE